MYRKTILENGIRIVTEKIPYVHSIAMGIWVNVGSRDEEPGERGLTHFVEHMLFKGTERRNALDIAKELDAVGGFANAFTSKEQICVHAKVLDNHLPLVVDLLTDIFLRSTFSPQEIEREREVILQEIRMIEDTPDEYVHVLFQELFWKENPLGRPIYGTDDVVRSFEREHCLRYLARTFHPGRIVVAAAGNLDHNEFVRLLAPPLERLDYGADPLVRETPADHHVLKVIPKDLEQVHLCLGIRGCSQLDEHRFSCHLLNVILGSSMSSRLFQEIREKRGLAYSVYSFLNCHEDTGLLGVYAGVGPENVEEALDLIHQELLRFSKEPIPEPELNAAKEYVKGSMYLNAEGTDSRMNRLAKNEFLFGRLVPFEEIERQLNAVTPEAIQEWFRTVAPSRERMPMVALGPVDPDKLGDDAEVIG